MKSNRSKSDWIIVGSLMLCALLASIPALQVVAQGASETLVDFESGLPGGWFEYEYTGIGQLTTAVVTVQDSDPLALPGQIGANNILQADFAVVDLAGFCDDFSATTGSQDWSGFEGLSSWFRGSNTGLGYEVVIFDNRSDTSYDTAERFSYVLLDDFSGWAEIEMPFAAFSRDTNFQPVGAPDDGLTLTEMWGWCVQLRSGGMSTVFLDDVGLFGGETPFPYSVTIAGSLQDELGCPGDWQPECANTYLTYDVDDQVWQGVFAVPSGSYEYKAALNSSWDENYGANATLNGANIPLSLAADTDVKFYYDHDTHWVADSWTSVIAVAVGTFQSEMGCGGDWDPGCLRSWLQDPDGDGTFLFATTAIPPGSYEFKVAIDESWSENYGAGGVPNGPFIPFTVAVPATVHFSYDPVTHLTAMDVIPLGPITLDVDIDIRPGTYPNDINLRSRGVVPVAILTTDSFDATTVDPVTVLFAGASPLRWSWEDADYDGDVDLVFHFKTQELNLDENSIEATLTGETFESFGGTAFEAVDSVNIVP